MIEGVRILEPGEPDGSHEEPPLATPRRIEVHFTTQDNLEAVRKRRGLDTMSSVLFACEVQAWRSEQLVRQGPEALVDDGRVRWLGSGGAGGHARYTAVFDDILTRLINTQFFNESAIGRRGGLCLSLRGGSMVFAARSATVRLPALR